MSIPLVPEVDLVLRSDPAFDWIHEMKTLRRLRSRAETIARIAVVALG
jgi:hypothetical protein